MKNFTFLAILFLSLVVNVTSAQDAPLTSAHGHSHGAKVRCGTTEYYDELFRTIPGFRAQFEANQQRIAQLASQRAGQRTAALNDTVPVVIHVIGSAAQHALITDAILQSQIDVLNEDFQGKNADSTRIPAAFKPLYGKMGLTFKLALTSPNGTLTNGIERRTNAVTFSAATADNAKRFANGGLDAWDPTKYLNLWVVEFTGGLLGISVFPGDPRPIDVHGFVCDYRAFGRGASYLNADFNRGRTTTHELGHFWNLRHIWGDDNGACTGSDFPTTAFPLGTDDTPNQARETYGNPDAPGTGTVLTDACSAAAPGIMYQNYMDYTNDIALVMFTNGQAARMEGALTVAPDRNPVLNSNAYNPPVLYPNDASISAIINPTASLTACTTTSTPQVTLHNIGTNPLTSAIITVTVNGATPAGYPYAWTGTLAPNTTANVTLPAITLATGNNTVVVTVSQPNGVADQNTTNDAKSLVVNVSPLLNLPVTEGFESTTFPPAPWTVVSVNTIGTANWTRNTPGNASTGALYINNYNNSSGAIDDFRSGNYAVNATDRVKISFDVAHRPYNATTADSLLVLVSTDCGATFTEVYKKWSSTTAGPNTLNSNLTTTGTVSYVPVATDWRKETITVPAALLANGRIQVIFRSRSRFGNNIWVDNINIEKIYDRDLKISAIVSPAGNVCTNTVTPQVTVINNGSETINSFQLTYAVNGAPAAVTTVNTPLAAGASTTVTLATSGALTNGAKTITVTASNVVFASGLAEEETANNTLSGTFTIVPLQTVIQEGFEGTPAGWTVANPNGNNTWVITTPGNNSSRSAFINNYDFDVVGNIDDLRSPYLNTAGIDSVFVTFDVAHKNYTGQNDRLQVIAITGCGTVAAPTTYNKAGATLATAGSSTDSYLAPAAGDWRNERVAIGNSILGTGGNLLVAFRNTNDFGNNIFIDNVNIIPLFRRDLRLVSINTPSAVTCSTSIAPSVTVMNNGSETITGYKVAYTINNVAQTATVVTGVSIPRNSTATITLTAATVAPGTYTLRVYSFEPITASGTGDNFTGNDTLTKTITVVGTLDNLRNSPLVEGFESTTFPPIANTGTQARWAVINPDGTVTWRRANVGNNSTGSAFINTYNYPTNGQKDDLVTPFLNYGSVDTVKLSFDLAATTFSYPGSTAIPMDTLEVLVTRDCGNTFTSVYKKWGTDLQTVNAPNDPQSGEFVPNSANVWRRENIDLTQFAQNSPIAIMFRVTNNFENNIFIDNVNFSATTVPDLLKSQGYLVLPTAFTNKFRVWHYQTPSTVKHIGVYNSAGQLVFMKQYNGNAERQIEIDLTGKAAGVYVVEVGYTDANRNIVQRVIKL